MAVMAPNASRQFKTIFSEAQQQLYKVFGMTLTELPQKEKITISQKRGSFLSILVVTVLVLSTKYIDLPYCSDATFAKRHHRLQRESLRPNFYPSSLLPHFHDIDTLSYSLYFRGVSIHCFLHVCHLRDIPLTTGHDP